MIKFTDSHTHLYLEEFDQDRDKTINRAIKNGVERMLLPNIDSASFDSMIQLHKSFPDNCFPMAGLHPTSVKENYKDELAFFDKTLKQDNKYVAIGEAGIDLYWDTTFIKQQKEVFEYQMNIAKELNLPIVIHARKSLEEIFDIVSSSEFKDVRGVFHCYPGDLNMAKRILDLGYYIGVGGVVTFKNSKIQNVIKAVGLSHILLETDSPYLTPVPFRGRRNESLYIIDIAEYVAKLCKVDLKEISLQTEKNLDDLFFAK